MYKTTRFKNLSSEEKSSKFKLSFVDNIEKNFSDYDEETKRYVETEQYKIDKERWGWNNPHLHFKQYPSPEFKPWIHTMWAYFSEVEEMGYVEADDANDAPYSCNCGSPYDSVGEKEITVLKVPFSLPEVGWKLEVKYPNSWPIVNEPWCMDDINLGGIPWIWARTYSMNPNKGVSIYAGDSPETFLKKLSEIWKLWSEVTQVKIIGDHPWTVPGEGNEGEWWEVECNGSTTYFTIDTEEQLPKILELYQFNPARDPWETCWENSGEDIPKEPTIPKDYDPEDLLKMIKNYNIDLV